MIVRVPHLRSKLAGLGTTFRERSGIEIPNRVHDEEAEYRMVRDHAALCDFSFMQKYIFPEDTGIELLDDIFPGNVAKLRFGRVLHTFLADDNGQITADCYIANNDDEIIVFCESLIDDSALSEVFTRRDGTAAGMRNITDSHTVLSVDGVDAWKVVKDVFGLDVLGLPYLSIEQYPYEDIDVSVIRAGKTSEFGYQVLVPNSHADSLFQKLYENTTAAGGGLCGLAIHDLLRLEGRFFNVFAEGMSVKTPLELGLQWMIDFHKDGYNGCQAISAHRQRGVDQKIIGISYRAPNRIVCDDTIYDGGAEVARIHATCHSYQLDCEIGLALFPVATAYAGLEFKLGGAEQIPVQTISMPPIMPKSLGINLTDYY